VLVCPHQHYNVNAYTSTIETQPNNRVKNDASARPPNLTSASCDLASLQQNRFIRFQNIVFTSLVTRGRTAS